MALGDEHRDDCDTDFCEQMHNSGILTQQIASLIHALSSARRCGRLSRNQHSTSAGSNRGAVDAISHCIGTSGSWSGVGLKIVGSIISSDSVLSRKASLRTTRVAIGDASSSSKLTHQYRKSIPLDSKLRKQGIWLSRSISFFRPAR